MPRFKVSGSTTLPSGRPAVLSRTVVGASAASAVRAALAWRRDGGRAFLGEVLTAAEEGSSAPPATFIYGPDTYELVDVPPGTRRIIGGVSVGDRVTRDSLECGHEAPVPPDAVGDESHMVCPVAGCGLPEPGAVLCDAECADPGCEFAT